MFLLLSVGCIKEPVKEETSPVDTEATDTSAEDTSEDNQDVEDTEVPEDPLEGALNFSLTVVETYFDNSQTGFDNFVSLFHDPFYLLEEMGAYSVSEVFQYEASHPFGMDYSMYTMEDYLAQYLPYVLAYDEYVELEPAFANIQIGDWQLYS